LAPLGKNFIDCGQVSAGQISKICNNTALAIQLISICEATIMGERLGMDPLLLNNIFMVGYLIMM
jgi:3-hydroxyisobutyrate dehydrogenase